MYHVLDAGSPLNESEATASVPAGPALECPSGVVGASAVSDAQPKEAVILPQQLLNEVDMGITVMEWTR